MTSLSPGLINDEAVSRIFSGIAALDERRGLDARVPCRHLRMRHEEYAAATSKNFCEKTEAEILEEYCEKDYSTSELKLVRNGFVLPTRAYCDGNGSTKCVLERVLHFFNSGYTVVLNRVHKLGQTEEKLRGKILETSNSSVRINAYITPSNATGFSIHYDVHDVIIVQCVGKKQWTIFDNTLPKEDPPATPTRVFFENRKMKGNTFEVGGGDLVFIRRGVAHVTSSLNSTSIHLTIGLNPNWERHE